MHLVDRTAAALGQHQQLRHESRRHPRCDKVVGDIPGPEKRLQRKGAFYDRSASGPMGTPSLDLSCAICQVKQALLDDITMVEYGHPTAGPEQFFCDVFDAGSLRICASCDRPIWQRFSRYRCVSVHGVTSEPGSWSSRTAPVINPSVYY
jgi:hypothetical protein